MTEKDKELKEREKVSEPTKAVLTQVAGKIYRGSNPGTLDICSCTCNCSCACHCSCNCNCFCNCDCPCLCDCKSAIPQLLVKLGDIKEMKEMASILNVRLGEIEEILKTIEKG